jgi:hypothetical protein
MEIPTKKMKSLKNRIWEETTATSLMELLLMVASPSVKPTPALNKITASTMTATIDLIVTNASKTIEVVVEDSNNVSMNVVSVTLTITAKEDSTTMVKEDSTTTVDLITIEALTTAVVSITTEDSTIIAASTTTITKEDSTTTVEAEVSKIANSTMIAAHKTILWMRATFWTIIPLSWAETTSIETATTSTERATTSIEIATNLETTTVLIVVWKTSSTIITTTVIALLTS